MLRLALVLLMSLALLSCLKESDFSSKQPDKVLFDRAAYALENKRIRVAGITLQTLINTYPDSGYAVMAKKMLEHEPGLAECRLPSDVNNVFDSDENCLDH